MILSRTLSAMLSRAVSVKNGPRRSCGVFGTLKGQFVTIIVTALAS
jgi:hypothetical protein